MRSIAFMSFSKCGDQTGELNSKTGRTKVLNKPICRFRSREWNHFNNKFTRLKR